MVAFIDAEQNNNCKYVPHLSSIFTEIHVSGDFENLFPAVSHSLELRLFLVHHSSIIPSSCVI